MRPEEIRAHYATPLNAPAYPPVIPRYRHREYLNIHYRTDVAAARAVVPEPLEVDDPVVRLEFMKMGDVTGYGPYCETGQALSVSLNGERGEYMRAMYVDNFAAAAGGREVGAYPKAMGASEIYVDSGALVGTLDYGTLRVAVATMGYKHHAMDPGAAASVIGIPTYMLKFALNYDASLRLCELARIEPADVVIHEAWSGPARVQLFEHVLAPLADLPVREIVSAGHIVADLSLGGWTPVHDYLTEKGGR